MRTRWNAEKDTYWVNVSTGEVWWREVSKEVFADEVRGVADVCWRLQQSFSDTIKERQVGFPQCKRRGTDHD